MLNLKKFLFAGVFLLSAILLLLVRENKGMATDVKTNANANTGWLANIFNAIKKLFGR